MPHPYFSGEYNLIFLCMKIRLIILTVQRLECGYSLRMALFRVGDMVVPQKRRAPPRESCNKKFQFENHDRNVSIAELPYEN